MKAVFIQPYYQNVWESIGVGYIMSYCKKHVPDWEYDFFQGNFDSDKVILDGCQDADVVAFSCTTPTFQHALHLAKMVKEINPRARTVFGSWHPTALKEKTFEDGRDSVIDQIVVGEGEMAFANILKGNTDKIVMGSALGFNELPWPDREGIKNHRTVELCHEMVGQRITSFQANRVCPVNCIFCSEKIMTGRFNRRTNAIRSRDPKDVCDEIEHVIKEFDLDYFKFVDATFDISAQYVIDFCKEKIKRGITTEWECLIHAVFCTEEMFQWLKKSNCNQINIGVESGSDKVLRKVGKGTSTKTVRKVFKWGRTYGIERRAFFILGMPNETEDDLILTDQFIEEIEPDVIGFTILCPYPGSDLYDHEKYRHIDWAGTDEYSNDFWHTEHLTNQRLKEWQAYLNKKYADVMCERVELGNTNIE